MCLAIEEIKTHTPKYKVVIYMHIPLGIECNWQLKRTYKNIKLNIQISMIVKWVCSFTYIKLNKYVQT